jgi:hypothetical protein
MRISTGLCIKSSWAIAMPLPLGPAGHIKACTHKRDVGF